MPWRQGARQKEADMGEKEAGQMDIGQIQEMARRAGLKGVERMSKEDLLRAMKSKPQDWKNIPGNQS
jgi:hypothetical protein